MTSPVDWSSTFVHCQTMFWKGSVFWRGSVGAGAAEGVGGMASGIAGFASTMLTKTMVATTLTATIANWRFRFMKVPALHMPFLGRAAWDGLQRSCLMRAHPLCGWHQNQQ